MIEYIKSLLPQEHVDFLGQTLFSLYAMALQFWIIFPIGALLIFLIVKYTDKNIFGLKIICGMFGDGKTYNNSLQTLAFSKKGFFVISNIRNSFTNLVFDSVLDLERIFSYIMEYARITNNKEFIDNGFRPIVFNIDEAHNYFFSRSFERNINKDNLMVSTQVRKRSILLSFITQELAQLDVFFRRLTGGLIMRYYAGLGFLRFWKLFYVPDPETTNLNSEDEGVEVKKRGIYLAPNFLTFLSKNRRELLPEKYVSKIIVGYEDLLNNYSFMDFLQDIYPPETKKGIEFWKIYKNQYGDTQIKTEFENEIFVRKEKEEIKKRLEEIQLETQKRKIKKFDLEKEKSIMD